MPRPTRGSQKAVKREDDDIDGVKASKPTQSVAATKRKADSEPDADSKVQASKAVKKRKGKGKGDEEAMVLAERTAVSALGKAMYIGAHVSAAGGTLTPSDSLSHIYIYIYIKKKEKKKKH